MKKGVIIFTVVFLFVMVTSFCPVFGQVPEQYGQYMDTRMAELTKKLKLTEEQVPKVRSILAENQAEQMKRIQEAREKGSRMDRGKMAKMAQENQKALEDKLGEVLTKDQLKEYKKQEEIRRANARSRMMRGGGGMGMGR